MDSIKLQAVINKIKVVVGDFNYFARNSSIATIKFDSLSGVSNLIVGAPHNLSFSNLASAGNITLGTNYDNRVKAVDFGALVTASSINMGTVSFAGTSVSAATTAANTIEYANANHIDLGALPYYTPSSLSITLDSGGSLDLSLLDDIDSAGEQDDLNLAITGADTVYLPNYEDGNFSATDVGTVDLPKWTGDSGTLTLSQVRNIKLGAVEVDVVIGSAMNSDNDLETLEVIAAKGADDSDTAPAVRVWSTSLETAKVAGVTGDVLFQNSPSLTSVALSSKSVGTITLDNNANLDEVDLTGEAAAVVVSNNSDLESLIIGTTTVKSSAENAALDGQITVTDNVSLVSLTISSDHIESLTITGNDDLNRVDLSALSAIGETGAPTVNIFDNDLTASRATNEVDGTTDVADGVAGDLGTFSTNSGLDSAKDYLSIVAADADSTAAVYFDTVDVFYDENNNETSNLTYVAGAANQSNEITVLVKTPNTAATGRDATRGKRSWIVPSSAGTLQLTSGNPTTTIFANSVNISSGNAAVSLINIDAETSYASAAGITLTAQQGGNSTVSVAFNWHNTTGTTSEVIGERHTTATASTGASSSTNHGFGADEVITFKVGSNTVTTTVAGGLTASTLASAATAIQTAYNSAYGMTGTASASALATVSAVGSTLNVTGLDPGSRGHGLEVSLSVAAGTTTSTNGLALDWVIGGTRATSDNSTTSQNIILTLESNTAGVLSDATSPTTITLGFGTATALSSTQLTNGTDPNAGTYTAQQESRNDVTIAEDAVAAATSNAVYFSRVGWL